MSKKGYYLSIIILSCFIIFCILSTNSTTSSISFNQKIVQSKTPEMLPLAHIIIPKIKLDNPLYHPKSLENTVEKNVMILDGSVFPKNNDYSIIFLAAHSGSGDIAYFNDLDQLSKDDILILQYQNYNYYYKIDSIFEEDKDGDIEINKTSNQQLILTTCSKSDLKKQLIINSNLYQKEEIT